MGTVRACDILSGLLSELRTALPNAQVREGYEAGPGSWLITKPLILGQLISETIGAGVEPWAWQAKVGFDIYLPRGSGPRQLQEIAEKITQTAQAVEEFREAVSTGPKTDKTVGCLMGCCEVSFSNADNGELAGNRRYPVEINGVAGQVLGWKLSESESGKRLTAIGESEAFYSGIRRQYNIELQGLDILEAGELSNFTLRLMGRTYTGCRWKSFTAQGTAVAVSENMSVDGEG